jgi:serine/threonine-protein kinase
MTRPLDPETWRRVDEILDVVLERPADERAAYLDDACADEPELRSHVEALLEADESAGEFLEESADRFAGTLLDDLAPPDDGLPAGTHVGPWRVLRLLGRGGMGTVHLAERADGAYQQETALKVVRAGLDSGAIRSRFLLERQILAGLKHPGIAGLLDGGVTDEGLPWFALEYVDGEPITTWADRQRLDVDARLRLMIDVCAAVAYAQRHLVVHRDLKPSNVMVTTDGQVKLLDFGIAKLFGGDEDEGLTRDGSRLLTPEYAAPEQLRGDPVTTATDVWALGCILHELLAGVHPFEGRRRGTGELERAILEEPSRQLARAVTGADDTVARTRSTSLGKLKATLSGDLSNICGRALEKSPEQRYASAEALREDLVRHRAGLPIEARAPSVTYRLRKYVSRNRLAVVAGIALFVALVAGLATTSWQARRADREARQATEVKEFLVGLFDAADPEEARGREVTAAEIVDLGTERIDRELADAPGVQAELLRILGRIQLNLGNYSKSRLLFEQSLEVQRDLRGNDDPNSIRALVDLGSIHHLMSDDPLADSLLVEAVSRARRHPPGNGGLARALVALADSRKSQARYEEAEALYREAIDLDRREFGDRHPEVSTDRNNLATLLSATGREQEALELHRDLLAIRRETLPPDHPTTANTLSNLGETLIDLGEYEEAEQVLEEAAAMRRRIYGGSHPRLATTLRHLALLHRKRDDLDGARALLEESLAMSRAHHGDVHEDVASCLNELAINAFYREDLDEAADRFAESLALFEQILPEGHPTLLTLMNNLATVAMSAGDIDRAEASYVRLLGMRREKLGDVHTDVAQAWIAVGNVHVHRGRWTEAVACCSTAVAIRQELLGPDAIDTADYEGYLGRALGFAGRHADAEAALRHAAGCYASEFPDGHRRRTAINLELARVLARTGPSDEALLLATDAESWCLENHGEDSTQTTDARIIRGETLLALGRHAEAERVLSAAAAKSRAQRGAQHLETRRAETALAKARR